MIVVVPTTATPPPATPKPWNDPKPKMNKGDSGISSATPTQMTSEGKRISPLPRMTLAKPFITQRIVLPANTTSE